MALTLPYPNMNFVPLDVLTAAEQNQLVANIEYISNQFPITSQNVDWTTINVSVHPDDIIDTNWASSNFCQVSRFGKIVDVSFNFHINAPIAADANQLFYTGLPRPGTTLVGTEIAVSGRSSVIPVTIGGSGNFMVYGIHEAIGSGASIHGHFMYIASSANE